jgi:hypothetical protein
MRKITIKSVFLMAALAMGATGAWAQNILYSQNYEAEGATVDWTTSVAGRFDPIIAVDTDENHYLAADPTKTYNNGATLTANDLNVAAGNITMLFDLRLGNANSGTPAFTVYDADGAVLFELKATAKSVTTWIVNGDAENPVTLNGTGYINNSTVADRPWYRFQLSYNSGITYLTITAVATGTVVLERTIITGKSSVGGVKKMTFATSKSLAKFAIDNVVVREIADGDLPLAAATSYTIKYVNENNESIREDLTVNSVAGEDVTASEAQMSAITYNAKKYLYKSGNAVITLDENADNNVIVLVYREASVYSYSIKAIDNAETPNELKVLLSGSGFESDVINLLYPRYINAEGTLYEAPANEKKYTMSYELSEDNFYQTITYSPTEVTGVLYYVEGEEIEGATVLNTGNTAIRSSQAQSGYAPENLTIKKLSAGRYTLTAGLYGPSSAGATFNFVVGSHSFSLSTPNTNLANVTSDEFIVTEETDLVLQAGGGKSAAIDYLYIVRVGDIPTSVDATITSAGYATFSSSYALDFSGVTDLKAYVASSLTVDGAVVMTRVEGAVPANTGLLLKGSSASIPVVASATAPAANFLVATVAEAPVAASADGAYNYMLANGDNGLGFYKVETATTSAAGKAYLQTTTALGEASGTKAVKMIFSDGAVTGISEIDSAAVAADGVYYNLNGVRVQNPTKGLYILNGKKVMK